MNTKNIPYTGKYAHTPDDVIVDDITYLIKQDLFCDDQRKDSYQQPFYKPQLRKLDHNQLRREIRFITNNLQGRSQYHDNITRTLFDYMESMSIILCENKNHQFQYSINYPYLESECPPEEDPETEEPKAFIRTAIPTNPVVLTYSETDKILLQGNLYSIEHPIRTIDDLAEIIIQSPAKHQEIQINYTAYFHQKFESFILKIINNCSNKKLNITFSISGPDTILELAQKCLPPGFKKPNNLIEAMPYINVLYKEIMIQLHETCQRYNAMQQAKRITIEIK